MRKIATTVSLLCVVNQCYAMTYTFDSSLLSGKRSTVDLSAFNNGGQLPGIYTVEVYLNSERVDSRKVAFELKNDAKGNAFLQPCLSMALLSRYGVNIEEYSGLSSVEDIKENDDNCANLSAIPNATTDFQFNNQQLMLSIPQAALRPKEQGIAPQAQWDDGIPALLMNYDANTYTSERRNAFGNRTNSHSVQLQPGANLGTWRLRSATIWQQSGDNRGKWQTAYTYAERGLYKAKSRLTLGDRNSPWDIFDSVPFRGAMLSTDDAMIPYNLRGFSPVVRGIARTQARVEVKQNGYVISNTTVPPGAFALNDLALGSGSGGDLKVTVWESDGRTQIFTVPYSTPAIALRKGAIKYNLMAGQYRPANSSIDRMPVGQATIIYGMPWDLTMYGGVQASDHYRALALGLGWSIGSLGSLSFDVTQSRGQRKEHDTESGGTWRVRYSKLVEATNTMLNFASYQHASIGYNTLSEVLDSYSGERKSYFMGGHNRNERRKSNSTLTLSQTVGRYGSFNVNGSRTSYWNRPGNDNSFGIGYGISFDRLSISLNWMKNTYTQKSGVKQNDNVTSLSLTMYLDKLLGRNTSASYQLTSPSRGAQTQQLGLSGNAFDNQLNWNVAQSYISGADTGSRNNGYLNTSFLGRYGELGGNYSYNSDVRQMGANITGGMVVHSKGVTLSQRLGETIALVEAPGASGVAVGGWPGVKTDFRGYTTQAYLIPYNDNIISLDPKGLPIDVEITHTDKKIVPTKGAIVAAKFATRVGGRALMTMTQSNGKLVPFGAFANLAGQNAGFAVVGKGGEVYLTGLPEKGEIVVNWSEQQCRGRYTLPKEKGLAGLYNIKMVCQ